VVADVQTLPMTTFLFVMEPSPYTNKYLTRVHCVSGGASHSKVEGQQISDGKSMLMILKPKTEQKALAA